MMAGTNYQVDKIDVNGDSSVSRKTAVINGKTYGKVVLICVCPHDVELTVEYGLSDRRTRCWLHPHSHLGVSYPSQTLS